MAVPLEVSHLIGVDLSYTDLASLCKVNTGYQQLCQDEYFWYKYYQHNYRSNIEYYPTWNYRIFVIRAENRVKDVEDTLTRNGEPSNVLTRVMVALKYNYDVILRRALPTLERDTIRFVFSMALQYPYLDQLDILLTHNDNELQKFLGVNYKESIMQIFTRTQNIKSVCYNHVKQYINPAHLVAIDQILYGTMYDFKTQLIRAIVDDDVVAYENRGSELYGLVLAHAMRSPQIAAIYEKMPYGTNELIGSVNAAAGLYTEGTFNMWALEQNQIVSVLAARMTPDIYLEFISYVAIANNYVRNIERDLYRTLAPQMTLNHVISVIKTVVPDPAWVDVIFGPGTPAADRRYRTLTREIFMRYIPGPDQIHLMNVRHFMNAPQRLPIIMDSDQVTVVEHAQLGISMQPGHTITVKSGYAYITYKYLSGLRTMGSMLITGTAKYVSFKPEAPFILGPGTYDITYGLRRIPVVHWLQWTSVDAQERETLKVVEQA